MIIFKGSFYIFYFVKGCGSYELNFLFGITFDMNWSIFVKLFYRFHRLFKKMLILLQSFFLILLQKYVSCRKYFQDFSCCVLFGYFLLGRWFPNTSISYIIFKNFASCLKRQKFLLHSKRLYHVRRYCKIVLNAYFIEYLYCATLCQIFLLHYHCPYLQNNDLFEFLMIELIQMEVSFYFY